MRLLLSLIIFLMSFVANASNDKLNQRNWQPIIGAKKSPTLSLFFDRNNHIIVHNDKGDYVSGSILFVSNVDVVVEINGKKITTRSLIKNYVVDCSTGLALAYSDYFYSMSTPVRESSSVASIFRDTESVEVLPKASLMLSLFCPTFI